MQPNQESNRSSNPYDKYIVVGDFDVSDESDYYQDEERWGEFYIKNARYYPIKDEDYYFLKKEGNLEVEKRTKRVDMYCDELGLIPN